MCQRARSSGIGSIALTRHSQASDCILTCCMWSVFTEFELAFPNYTDDRQRGVLVVIGVIYNGAVIWNYPEHSI